MRISELITRHQEDLLSEWEQFARTLYPAGAGMDVEGLRNFASGMLAAIAADLETPQTTSEQLAKSHAQRDTFSGSAAERHGAARAQRGFTLEQMVSEFRALRASVTRRWCARVTTVDREQLEDLVRFNEAIDQALAESIARYKEDLDHAKDMFLGILGHDLRNPLSAIMMLASRTLSQGSTDRATAKRILNSGERMRLMIDDLLDFTRSRLGAGIPIAPCEMDMAQLCRETVDEIAASQPRCHFHVESTGRLLGRWDVARIGQVLSNLVANAVQHGEPARGINVSARGHDGLVSVSVHNYGPSIPPGALQTIFTPMKRGNGSNMESGGLGLGLFIANEIVAAHGGHIDVESSSEGGTTFTVVLPQNAAARAVVGEGPRAVM